MQITTEVETSDYRAFLAHQRATGGIARFYTIMFWWFLVLIAVWILLSALNDPTSASTTAWIALLVIWLLAGKRLLVWISGQITARALTKLDLSSHLGSQVLEIRDDGLHCTAPAGTGVILWPALKRIETTDTHTFLYVSDVSAIVIPHRCVSPSLLGEFVTGVRARAAG